MPLLTGRNRTLFAALAIGVVLFLVLSFRFDHDGALADYSFSRPSPPPPAEVPVAGASGDSAGFQPGLAPEIAAEHDRAAKAAQKAEGHADVPVPAAVPVPKPGAGAGADLAPASGPPGARLPDPPPYSGGHGKVFEKIPEGDHIVHMAHKLSTPDDFDGHVRAINEVEPMSIDDTTRECYFWRKEYLQKIQFQHSKGEEHPWTLTMTSVMETNLRRMEWVQWYQNKRLNWNTSQSHFEGKGIVSVAGNKGNGQRLGVLLRQLSRLGSKLPVEIFYWKTQLSQHDQEQLSSAYHTVTFRDLSQKSPDNLLEAAAPLPTRGLENLKLAALINSKFAEVMMIDADNLPLRNPDILFESSTYKEFGTIFWPDLIRTRPESPMWPITQKFCQQDEYEMESGQLLVDKTRFFYHIQLANFFNDNPFYHPFLLGKDAMRWAWHGMQTRWGAPHNWTATVGTQHEVPYSDNITYCGHSYVQFAPDGEPMFMHGAFLKTFSPTALQYYLDQGGLYTHYKRSKGIDADKHYMERALIFNDDLGFTGELDGQPAYTCMDLSDVTSEPADELFDGLEALVDDLGAWWVLDANPADLEGSNLAQQITLAGTLKLPQVNDIGWFNETVIPLG